MRSLSAALLLSLLPLTAAAQAPAGAFRVENLDRSTPACADFYQFACGGWMKANPLPGDMPRYGRFAELAERNRSTLREILEAASRDAPGRSVVDRQIGDYYAACMDEPGIEAQGLKPVQDEFARIAALKGTAELPALVASLQRGGVNALFRIGAQQDFKDATQVIASVDQGGLGLPDRDYYLKDDKAELRAKYQAHVQRMLELAGETPEQAKAHAATVMAVETSLAKAAIDRVSRREPSNVYHRVKLDELRAMAPAFDWSAYLAAVGAPSVAELNVAVPGFVQGLQTGLTSIPLDDWKTYLRWRVVDDNAALLPKAFVDEDFEFGGRTLTGAKEQRPRWKRCVDLVDAQLGEALGQAFVAKTYGPDAKRRMAEMVPALEKALAADIAQLPWMTAETRTRAHEKLQAIANKVGHPEKWRDYAKLEVRRNEALLNAQRGSAFEFARQVGKIGRPVDRNEWLMSPPTVNAYYEPSMNDINFPVGILQPPFFQSTMDDAINYGGIGSVIGHELTHGFDDEGRKFDAQGNLKDWWTAEDAREFEKRAECFVNQYADYEPVPGTKQTRKLTLGEDTADNGGVRIAFMALQSALAGKKPAAVDGFTSDQRFFLGWAQLWCENQTPEMAKLRAQVDPHSAGRFRVNGVVSNSPEFKEAFGCKAGDAMVRENACRVW